MNKIFGFVFMACCAMGFVACDDDTENPYAHESAISIVSADVNFTARADQGTVKFKANGTVTAVSTVDWCNATVSGDSVIVSVAQNTKVNGRSTVVVLKCAGDTKEVAVIQDGIIFQVEGNGIGFETDEATNAKYRLTTNVDFVVASAPSWVTATVNGDSLEVAVTANTTGAPRIGHLKLVSGGYEDSVKIVQADFDKDIAGSYKMYYKTKNGDVRNMNVTLSASGMKMISLNVPVSYDPVKGELSVSSGSYVGKSGSNYLYLAFATVPDADGRFYWTAYTNSFTMSAPFVVAPDGSVTAVFQGMLSGLPAERFMFRNFKAQSMTEANDLGSSTMDLYSPYLQRDAASTANLAYILR